MNVKQFAERVGLSAHTIRYYDKIGLFGGVARLDNGHRIFTEQEVGWIAFVQRLKETGMPLNQILVYAALRAKGDGTMLERQKLLEKHAVMLRSTIEQQQQHLEKLNEKIAFYANAITRQNMA